MAAIRIAVPAAERHDGNTDDAEGDPVQGGEPRKLHRHLPAEHRDGDGRRDCQRTRLVRLHLEDGKADKDDGEWNGGY